MAFFKSFQTNLPSVNISSILDSVSSRVDELANSVSDATYAVSDQFTEGVTTIVKKVQDTEEGDNVSVAAAQDGGGGHSSESKPRSKSIWQIARDNEPEAAANDGGDNTESAASQLEWEWRDGGWRVKLTAAELAEEERKKQERKEMEEQREQRRRERQAKRTEAQRKREEQGKGSRRESENEAEPVEEGVKEEEVEEEEKEDEEEEEEQEEEVAKTKRKKKKSDRKKKEDVKKEKTEEREKSKKKRKSKKKKGKEEAPSDSEEGEKEEEEERGPEPMAQQRASAWGSKEGSSSEASSERATIQRIHKDASLNELQPPPYPREEQRKTSASSQRSSRGRRPSHRSTAPAGSHQASEEDQEEQEEEEEEEADSESYLNKACDEDIPSDSTAVLGQEDVPPLPAAYEPEPMAKYGTLDVAFEYDSGEQWLAVTVTAATDIPALKQTGNISWQVHMVLLPTKKQRAKTGVQKGPCPVFTETFKFLRVEQDSLGDYAVRFRLYSIRRMKKEKVLGEKVFQLTKLNLHGKMALPVTLEPGSEATGCGSVVSVSRSGGALSYRSTEDSLPELLLGLVYNSTTGRLSAEVIQGSHFKTSATEKPIDTYVKLVMLDSKGKQMSKCRTGVCRGQPSPTYRESFVFQVSLFQLSEVSLVLSVFWRRSSLRPRERLGGVCLGLNSTSEEQSSHWNQMREAEGQQVCHWHTLTDT